MKIITTILLLYLSFNLSAVTVVHTKPFPSSIINQANTNITTIGDGFIPITYKDRIYIINHHASLSNTSFNCVSKDGTGMSGCTIGGATWPQRLPDGDINTPLFSATSGSNEEFAIVDGKLYYPVTRYTNNAGLTPQDWGIGCYNLDTHSECGYTLLSANPNNRLFTVAIEGPFQNGGKLYFLDLEMNLYCFDPLSSSLCGNIDLSLTGNGAIPKYTGDENGVRMGHIGGEVINDKLYITVIIFNHSNSSFVPSNVLPGKYAMCIDINTGMTPCTNWMANGGAQIFTSFGNAVPDNHSNFIIYSNASTITPVSLCNYGGTTLSCLSLSNGSTVSHPGFQSAIMPPGTFGLGVEATIWPRTYFPLYFAETIYCYNWLSASQCNGYPSAPPVSPTSNYAISVDSAGCIWANGHQNSIWSMNPLTRTSPCNLGFFSETVPKLCVYDEWLEFNVNGITSADFQSLELRIKDSNGMWVIFDLLNTSFPINLNTTNFKNLSSLEYEVNAEVNVTAFTTQPVITISTNNNSNGSCNAPPATSIPTLTIWSLFFLSIILFVASYRRSFQR
jgi:hypothetical protein